MIYIGLTRQEVPITYIVSGTITTYNTLKLIIGLKDTIYLHTLTHIFLYTYIYTYTHIHIKTQTYINTDIHIYRVYTQTSNKNQSKIIIQSSKR